MHAPDSQSDFGRLLGLFVRCSRYVRRARKWISAYQRRRRAAAAAGSTIQPPIPEPGYLWVPGYWAWDDNTGYYWVPGTWVLPPEPALLWTPGYWGWNDGVYVFHEGYWGPQIGFYGGVSYGFGYDGVGYEGGYWRDGAFFYNRSVNNISNVSITNVYNKTVVVNNVTNVSYNGGTGGTTAQPTPHQIATANEHHVAAKPAGGGEGPGAFAQSQSRPSNRGGHDACGAVQRGGHYCGASGQASRCYRAARPYDQGGHNARQRGSDSWR